MVLLYHVEVHADSPEEREPRSKCININPGSKTCGVCHATT